MPRRALLAVLVLVVAASGCKTMERLTFIRPSAARGDYQQVAPTYEFREEKSRPMPLNAHVLLGSAVALLQDGKLDEAERATRQVLKQDANFADAWGVLGAIADARGDAAMAGAHYRQAVALAPNTGTHANNYGVWLCGNGREAESLDWFDHAVADPAYPTRAVALANAGDCALRAGQAARAEGKLRSALALDPANAVALASMAQLQYDAGRYLDARAFSERRLAAAPQDVTSLQLASQIELKLGDQAAALRYLHASQALSPENPTIPRIP